MDQQTQQSPQSFIQIIFKETGSVMFYDAQVVGVTPLQLLAVAEYLRLFGEAGFAREQAQRSVEAERNKIVVPDGILVK